MTRKTGLALALLSLAVVCLGTRTAAAVTHHYDPFGSGSTYAYIGADPNDGYSHWIAWIEEGSSNCTWDQLSAGPTLSDTVEVWGLAGNDDIIILDNVSPVTLCGFSMVTPNYNGYSIYLLGGDGDDYLGGWGNGPGGELGGGGNDWIDSARPDHSLSGDSGNDHLTAYASSGSGAHITGGDGDDCLYVATGQSPFQMSCGNGTDGWYGPGTRPGDCENTVSSCY